MENFENKYKTYNDKLKNNIEIIRKLIEAEYDTDCIRIIIDPKNEEELLIADATITYLIDILAIFENITSGNIENIDLKNSFIIDFYIKAIRELKNNPNSTLEETIGNLDPAVHAKLIYDFLTTFANYQNKAYEIIAEKTGFDLDDDLSLIKFQLYVAKIKELGEKRELGLANIAKILTNKNDLNTYVEMSQHLHELCLNGLNKEPKVSDPFVKQLKITIKKNN